MKEDNKFEARRLTERDDSAQRNAMSSNNDMEVRKRRFALQEDKVKLGNILYMIGLDKHKMALWITKLEDHERKLLGFKALDREKY